MTLATGHGRGVGGDLQDPGGKPLAMFSQVVPPSARVTLGAEHKKTIIFEAELLAVVCALKLWSKAITAVIYVDNNSARDVAISGSARSEAVCRLLDVLLQEEIAAGIVPGISASLLPQTSQMRPRVRDSVLSQFEG